MTITEEDFQKMNLPDPVITQCTYYMENGKILDDAGFNELVKQCKEKYLVLPMVCAKEIANTNTGINTCFVRSYGSQMFDPRNKDSRYRSRNRWKLSRINKSAYDLYIRFLRTNHTTFLHQAEREL